ncbi:MAG: hypothetical protein E6X17_10295 [Sporomusaceae bacterium]|nr:hypothetical protein [Sporomusaceae bacterium]
MESSRQPLDETAAINHVGGVNEQLGGVDPQADENLMRLGFGC